MRSKLQALPRGGGRVRLEYEEDWAELILDHPQRRNAISPGMMLDLECAVLELKGWAGALVLVRGDTQAFCSGGDLTAVRDHLLDPGMAEAMSVHMGLVLDQLSRLPQLVVAAVDGPALGGGAEILMSADTIIAARSARVGFVHASLGVSPGWGGGARLISRVGARAALRVLAEARRLPANEALALGLIDQVCEGSALEAAREWLCELSATPTVAIRAAVSLVRSADPDQERREFLSLWGAEAHRNALEKMRSRS